MFLAAVTKTLFDTTQGTLEVVFLVCPILSRGYQRNGPKMRVGKDALPPAIIGVRSNPPPGWCMNAIIGKIASVFPPSTNREANNLSKLKATTVVNKSEGQFM